MVFLNSYMTIILLTQGSNGELCHDVIALSARFTRQKQKELVLHLNVQDDSKTKIYSIMPRIKSDSINRH